MAIQQFTAGQTLTANAMNTLQASDYNYTRKIVTAATYTTVLEDRGQLLEFQNAGGTTITIPLNSSVAYTTGDVLEIVNGSTATVTIVGDTGVTIEATGDITSLTSEWQKCQLIKRETNNWLLTGITSVAILDSVITDADVSPSAAIAKTKIAGTAITAADTGTVTSAMIADGAIVNADINASAAIALSKLATGSSGQLVVHNASGVPTATTATGDVTIDSSGVTSIASGVVVNADISSSAAIDLSKIADASIDTKTSNYTLVLTDKNKFIEMNITSSANTVSVPTDAAVNFPIGSQINITQYGTGKTQIVAVTPATTSIRSTPGNYLRAQYSSATLIKRAANEWYLIGDLSAS